MRTLSRLIEKGMNYPYLSLDMYFLSISGS
ncbi:Uncharacterised protein [Mycobacteroides abscessus subsp. massiliense]|nr:Uncharacterised protein [Mycobacteroides abscessus subsp. abscessus]SKF86266.1 Uncharacterised protein [Mycobacteroides abscessus subsp. massiliense]SKG52602.1 Uncharacterised protein [Mycobacteroides abscessus subsp. massiliense]SKI91886.1 Uncharacterised protein [Mycobacteroides abscessus subsp. massiliense]SKJ56445.1 Uncharacterised protein [Mycobacteroides abscessus subsp. massiliense]